VKVSLVVAKVLYVIFMMVSVFLAIATKFWFPSAMNDLSSFNGCNEDNRCLGNQSVYRFSFALTIWFIAIALFTLCDGSVHYTWWSVKFVTWAGFIIMSFYIPDEFFSGWADFARVVSLIFLVLQILILIDSAYTFHEYLLNEKISNGEGGENPCWKIAYILLCILGICICITSIGVMFHYYGGCGINLFFISLTLILGVLGIILSMLNAVGKGLLVPVCVWLYACFLLYQALYSQPDKSCNPAAETQDSLFVLLMGIIIASASLAYTSFNVGNSAPNLFRKQKEDDAAAAAPAAVAMDGGKGSENADDPNNTQPTPEKGKNYYAFHLLMATGAIYSSMLLTNWGAQSGSTQAAAVDTSKESMWVKIVSQWVTYILYIWTLVAPLVLPGREF